MSFARSTIIWLAPWSTEVHGFTLFLPGVEGSVERKHCDASGRRDGTMDLRVTRHYAGSGAVETGRGMKQVFDWWGALVLRRPVGVLVLSGALFLTCALGIARLNVDIDMQKIFTSGSEAHARYQTMQALFPSNEGDVILVVTDPVPLTPDRLEALSNLHLDLSLETGVSGVASPVSARRVDDGGAHFSPVVPAVIPTGAAFDTLIADLIADPLVGGRLLSSDARTALFSVALDSSHDSGPELRRLVQSLHNTADAILAPVGLTAVMTGTPAMRAELGAINEREQRMLILAGFLIGGLFSLAYFRRLSLVLLSGTVPVAAIGASYGVLGWLGVPLTLAMQIVGPLVVVIAFNNAMHMLFAIHHGRSGAQEDAKNDPQSVARAIVEIGPASLMTSLTSAIAFASLTLADSEVIRTFGALAAFGAMAAFFAVISIVPALAVLLIRAGIGGISAGRHADASRIGALCTAFDRPAARHAGVIAATGTALLAVFLVAQFTLVPRYLMSDNMPYHSATRTAISTIDTEIGGSQPLAVLVRWSAHDQAAEDEVIGHLRTLETRLADLPATGPVFSLATLAGWLAPALEFKHAGDLDAVLDLLPDQLGSALFNRDAGAALVSVMVPDRPTVANLSLIDDLEALLDTLAPAAPGFTFDATGIVALTTQDTGRIIGSTQISLLVAIVVIIGLIGVTFRRLWPAAISILPNLFPIAAGGAFLATQGGDLNFAGVIAMTVAFGLAVDDTIHMLYRFRRELQATGVVETALQRTVARIGPVLVVSSLVLIAGIGVLLLSEMPMNRDYAQLTILVFAAALVGDLLFLPALIRVFRRQLERP